MQPLASVIVQVYIPAGRAVVVAAVPPDGAQEYVYPGVPPETVTVAAPLLPPLHDTLVCEETEEVIAVGCVIVTVCVRIHAFASVIVHVYVLAASPVAVAAVPPLGAHE